MKEKRKRGRPKQFITKKEIEQSLSFGKYARTLPEWVEFRDITKLAMKTGEDFLIHGITIANAKREDEKRFDELDLFNREVKKRYSNLIAICGNRKNKPFLLKEANSLAGKRHLPKKDWARKASREEVANALSAFKKFAEAFVIRKEFSVSRLTEFLTPLLQGKRFTRQTVASILEGRKKTRNPRKRKS